jgi:hypothetical protein
MLEQLRKLKTLTGGYKRVLPSVRNMKFFRTEGKEKFAGIEVRAAWMAEGCHLVARAGHLVKLIKFISSRDLSQRFYTSLDQETCFTDIYNSSFFQPKPVPRTQSFN